MTSLPSAQGRRATSSTAASLYSDPSTASSILITHLRVVFIHSNLTRGTSPFTYGRLEWSCYQHRTGRLSQNTVGIGTKQRPHPESLAMCSHAYQIDIVFVGIGQHFAIGMPLTNY